MIGLENGLGWVYRYLEGEEGERLKYLWERICDG